MKRILGSRPFAALCVCIAVFFFLTSKGAAQQEHGSSNSRVGKSTVEFLAGAGGQAIGFVLLGLTILRDLPESSESVGGALPYAVGVASVSTLCSSGGVYLAGEALEDEGSFRGAFWSVLVPPVIGTVLGLADHGGIGFCPLCGAMFGSLASPLGATVGYALSRHPELPESQALLHIEDSKLRLGIPSPMLRPVVLSRDEVTWEYQIKLVSPRF